MRIRTQLSLTLALGTAHAHAAAEALITDEQMNFFERKIRPVLAGKCYECHSAQAKKVKGGLRLDSKEATLRGGDNGPAVVPGKPADSILITAIKWSDKDMQMPPKTQLPKEVIADFEAWIKMGAPDPRVTGGSVADADTAAASWRKKEINIEEGRKFWAFQPPVKKPAPQVKDASWPGTDIDRFVLARIEEKGLRPVADAQKLDLLRRVTFDLTGLPPSPDAISAFVKDTSPNALEKVVDNLLASDRFGEYWGRHWLDVARYAESSGKEVNVLYPFAWRYRDWVIEAMNKDMPFNEFVKQQIAGDLLPYKDARDQSRKIVATGFLAIGTKSQNERNPRQFALELADEQIDTMSQAMLGITVACARCHDHKFDPIPQKDYYALAGIFLSSDTLYGSNAGIQNAHPSDLIDLGRESGLPAGFESISAAQRAKIAKDATSARDNLMQTARDAMTARQSGKDKGNVAFRALAERQRMGELNGSLNRYDEQGHARILAMGVYDRKYPGNSPVYSRGDATQPGQQVPRGFVQVMFPGDPPQITKGSGRKELAEWLGSAANPLTARVFVNRAWRWLMGTGIVKTTDNFGSMGERPTNQDLLDYLAVRFMENGWSVKKLVKDIVLSHTYQLAARHDAQNFAADPDNNLFWRANKRRLDADQMRDSILFVSGKLDLYPKDGSPICTAGEGREGLFALAQMALKPNYHRSVYLPIIRDQVPESLSLFDFPDPSLVAGDREETNVPSQGLYLLNNAFVQALSDDFARRVYNAGKTDGDRITSAYWIAFSRPPTPAEMQASRAFFSNYRTAAQKPKGGRAEGDISTYAWSAFCQALMASAEFRYLN